VILCLHDVFDRDWLHSFFRDLAKHAEILSLAALLDRLAGARPAGPIVAVTFDDGYKSIRTIVEPVFTELGVPFTAFVCGEVLRGGLPPWYERVELLVRRFGPAWAAKHWALGATAEGALMAALKETPKSVVLRGLEAAELDAAIDPRALCDRFMNKADVIAVAKNPLATLGTHTYSHPILAHLTPSEQQAEIQRGLGVLRDVCGRSVEFFAYPNGKPEDFDAGVVQALRDAGLRAALTTVQRPLRRTDDLMRLPRLGVSQGDTVEKLELKWNLPWVSLGDARESRLRRRYRAAFKRSAWRGAHQDGPPPPSPPPREREREARTAEAGSSQSSGAVG
jgi:peptidoglycan/xylan/chitin deacetylase (PgdA/CDA1 family)